MKHTINSFRPLYHKFCVLPLEGRVAESCINLPSFEEACGVLAYGCCLGENGEFFLDVLCCVKKNGKEFEFCKPVSDTSILFQLETVKGMNYESLGSDKDSIMENFKGLLESQGVLEKVDKSLERTRKEKTIDQYRDERFIDVVKCEICKENFLIEDTWARVLKIRDNHLEAILLEEPEQKMGAHVGDVIKLQLVNDTELNQVVLYADLGEFVGDG